MLNREVDAVTVRDVYQHTSQYGEEGVICTGVIGDIKQHAHFVTKYHGALLLTFTASRVHTPTNEGRFS